MSSVGTRNTGPELVLRRLLHAEGYRYGLHNKNLPGRPDIVFRQVRKAIFVHGCFWHGHRCRWGKLPKSRLDYWRPKIVTNRKRDLGNRCDLEKLGWETHVVWQCELRANLTGTMRNVIEFLESQ
jgi:DNA mismatch endonuclease, patch repair protein